MRVLRLVARLLGWLLTPMVAWAASFFGAWIGAGIASQLEVAKTGLWVTILMGAATAIGATLAWMRLLRRSPHLREALALSEEGVPTSTVHEQEEVE